MFHLQGNGSGTSKDADTNLARLRELGEYLLRTREAKGKTIDEVVEATKVRSRYIKAIEEGDLNILPGIVYARGFVRGYADYLGLDGAEITAQYLGSLVDEEPVPTVEEKPFVRQEVKKTVQKPNKNVKVMAERKRKGIVGQPMDHRKQRSSGFVWTAVIVVLFTVAVVVYAALSNSVHPKSSQAAQSSLHGKVSTPSTHSKGKGKAKSGEANSPKVPAVTLIHTGSGSITANYTVLTKEPLKVVVKAVTGQCWFNVVADGKTIVGNLILNPGQQRTWTANSSMNLVVGASSKITMTVNGLSVPLPKVSTGGITYSFIKK